MWLRQQKSWAEAEHQVWMLLLLWYAEEHGERELMVAESALSASKTARVPIDLASDKMT